MDDQQRLEQALGRIYTVAVHPKGKGYLFFIRELGLRHQSEDLARGHAELLAMKDAWIRDVAAEGLWEWITPPGGEASAKEQEAPSRWRSLAPFSVKFVCVALLLLVFTARLSDAARDIGYNLEKKIDAVLLMPPDKLEANRQRARAFALKLKPIVQELTAMFRPDAEGSAPPALGQPAAGQPVPASGQ